MVRHSCKLTGFELTEFSLYTFSVNVFPVDSFTVLGLTLFSSCVLNYWASELAPLYKMPAFSPVMIVNQTISLAGHTFLSRKGLVSTATFLVHFPWILGEPYYVCIANGSCSFFFIFGIKHCSYENLGGLTNMLKLFHIDLCKYATNYNTVNCIPVGEIMLLQTPDPSVEGVACQTTE